MPINYCNLKEPRYIGTKERSWYCPACGKKYRNSLVCWKEHFFKGLKHKFERLYEDGQKNTTKKDGQKNTTKKVMLITTKKVV